MNKTKIDWADMTWNPVTGCWHNCEYCYAGKIARRFAIRTSYNMDIGGCEFDCSGKGCETGCMHILDGKRTAYPYGFDPTFHRYRLDEPAKIKKPQNIFVCSMADLFGDWVPDEWIEKVFEACEKAPQHRYLFLTKNGKRYRDFSIRQTENMWFGQTLTGIDGESLSYSGHNTFLSIEPILSEFKAVDMWKKFQWVIIGAESGDRKGKVIPKREWIENIVNYCKERNVPVFMKDSLKKIWGEPLVQEYPWSDKLDDTLNKITG